MNVAMPLYTDIHSLYTTALMRCRRGRPAALRTGLPGRFVRGLVAGLVENELRQRHIDERKTMMICALYGAHRQER